MPEMYGDIWTAAKGMYKAEPAMMDEGEVVIYAPHITEFSYTHGPHIERIGYHCRDYFVKQWKLFADVPRGVLAHSTHLRGEGAFDVGTGFETRPNPRDSGHRNFRGAMPSNESWLSGPRRSEDAGMVRTRKRRNQSDAARRRDALSNQEDETAFLSFHLFLNAAPRQGISLWRLLWPRPNRSFRRRSPAPCRPWRADTWRAVRDGEWCDAEKN